MTQALPKNTLQVRKTVRSRETRLAGQKALRLIFMLSACALIFSLILFVGNDSRRVVLSSEDSHNTVHLTAVDSPLNILILSPENVTYTVYNIPLKFTVDAPFSWAGYSLDSGGNVTAAANTTPTNLREGSHSVVVYANDTAGNAGSSQTVYLTIKQVSIQEIVFLGVLQGVTEWLPVSSTAHLKIAEHFLGLMATPLFSVILHLGTLIVVVFYFRKDVKRILSALARLDFKSEYGQLIPLIIAATIPTGIIGLLYVEFLESSLQTILAIGITFLIGATIVYTSRIGKENTDAITYRTALIMGAAQGFAIFPGLSRSGVTISAALLLGLTRGRAFRFSFLLSIPAIVGDLAVEAYHQRGQLGIPGIGPAELLIGVAIAMIAGYAAIKLVSKTVESKRFHYFALYTWLLGIALIALTLYGL